MPMCVYRFGLPVFCFDPQVPKLRVCDSMFTSVLGTPYSTPYITYRGTYDMLAACRQAMQRVHHVSPLRQRSDAFPMQPRLAHIPPRPPMQIGMVGMPADLTYKYDHLGSDPSALTALLAGTSPFFAKLKAAKRPMVVVGPGVLQRGDRDAVLKAVHELCEKAGE